MKKLSVGFAVLALMVSSTAHAANTVQDFTAIFEATGGGDAFELLPFGGQPEPPIEVIEGWDGNALRLTDEVNSQNNGFSLNQQVTGPFDELVFDFDFTISPGNGGGADGMGFVWANSDQWGADNSAGFPNWPGVAEEPNLSGSLGVGFDTFNNGDDDGGEQSVSLHYDGNLLDSIPMDEEFFGEEFLESGDILHATIRMSPAAGGANVSVDLENIDSGDTFTAYDNELIEGLSLYNGRVAMKARTGGANSEQVVDNVMVTAPPAGGGAAVSFVQDFEGFDEGFFDSPPPAPLPELVGGTPFSRNIEGARGSDPAATLIPENADPGVQEASLRLTTTVNGQNNSIAFDQTSDLADSIVATFDFKIDDSGNNADGMSFLILDANTYGDEGEIDGVSEEPNLEGALGLGFDTFNNDEETDFAEFELPGTRANHMSLHWDGAQVGDLVWLNPEEELDLVNGQWNQVTMTVDEVDDGLLVSVAVRDADGNEFAIFTEELVDGASFPDGARAAFGGRTGGATSNQSIDNVFIRWTEGDGVPCDFDGSGSLDVGDIDALLSEVKSGGNGNTFDITGDGFVNGDDIVALVEGSDKFNTYIGDSNLDGEFNSSDFVTVFTAGEYEDDTAMNSSWGTGDWNGDGDFDSSDFVFAFTGGGYEVGPRAGVAAVPEPSSALLLVLGGLACLRRRK